MLSASSTKPAASTSSPTEAGIDPMRRRLGIARTCSGGGGVIDDDVEPTRLQPFVGGSIEIGQARRDPVGGNDRHGRRRVGWP